MFCNIFNSDKSAVNILYFYQNFRCFLSCNVFATLQILQNIVKNTADFDISKNGYCTHHMHITSVMGCAIIPIKISKLFRLEFLQMF